MKIYLVESMSDLTGRNGNGLAALKANSDVLVSFAQAENKKIHLIDPDIPDEVLALLFAEEC